MSSMSLTTSTPGGQAAAKRRCLIVRQGTNCQPRTTCSLLSPWTLLRRTKLSVVSKDSRLRNPLRFKVEMEALLRCAAVDWFMLDMKKDKLKFATRGELIH